MIELPLFVPYSWPPGRACGEGAVSYTFYKGPRGDFSLEVQQMLDTLNDFDKRVVTAILQRVMRNAVRGLLTPVVKVNGKRIGHVDQMSISENRILEVRLEEMSGWNRKVFPGKHMRIYFAEPATESVIQFLYIAPKHGGRIGKREQNRHVKEALYRAQGLP